MYYLLYVLLGFSYINMGSSYVLLQVRKQDDNHSNVDALIHKVVPSGKVDQFANKLARKQFTQINERPDIENNLDNVVLSIDTGAARDATKGSAIEVIDKIIKTVSSFVNTHSGLNMRGQDYIKPEIVHFRADKPSVMFEINSKSIIKALKDVLASKTVAEYVDKITREAAVVYRSLQEEFKQK